MLCNISKSAHIFYFKYSGAVIAGKTVCEDLCFSGNSWTASTGPVKNPYNNKLSTGGSSCGSASLVSLHCIQTVVSYCFFFFIHMDKCAIFYPNRDWHF
jgi:hypothetical protein